MRCPHCGSTATTRRTCRTALGYRRFNCRSCRRRFNERTATPFNDLQYPTDIVLLTDLPPENGSSCRDRESVQNLEKGERNEQAEAVRS